MRGRLQASCNYVEDGDGMMAVHALDSQVLVLLPHKKLLQAPYQKRKGRMVADQPKGETGSQAGPHLVFF